MDLAPPVAHTLSLLEATLRQTSIANYLIIISMNAYTPVATIRHLIILINRFFNVTP
jgi:hypothetical protein